MVYDKFTDKDLVFGFDDFEHLCFRFNSLASSGDHHAHLVAVKGMHGVAFCHKDLLIVNKNSILAVGAADKCADIFGAAIGGGFVFAKPYFLYHVVGGQFLKKIDDIHLEVLCVNCKSDLLIVESLAVFLFQESKYLILKFGLSHPF